MLRQNAAHRRRRLRSDPGNRPRAYLIAIGRNGAVSVSLCKASGSAEEICNSGGPMMSPVVVTCISADGSGKSAKIEITAAKATMQ